MECPTCGQNTRVIETRGDRRRRECSNGHKFSTLEFAVDGERKISSRKTNKFWLSDESKKDIAESKIDGMTLAAKYGVHLSTIARIKREAKQPKAG